MRIQKMSKYFTKEFLKDWAFEKVRELMWPYILAAITFISGIMGDGIPMMYIIVATTAVFALLSFGLFWFSRWNFNRTPESKLSFASGNVAWDGAAGDEINVCLGINLRSTAEFPIKFKMKEIKTSLGDKFNPDPKYKTRIVTMPSSGDAFYNDDIITVDRKSLVDGIEGKISYTINYGAENSNLEYKLSKSHRCHLQLDENNMINYVYTDVDPE